MKTFLLAVSAAAMAVSTFAGAEVLLEVDLSVENEVTISATSGLSSATVTGSDGVGVYFEDFYAVTGVQVIVPTLGDLTASGAPSNGIPRLFRASNGLDPGLNLFDWSEDIDSNFVAGQVAFTGSGTWQLSVPQYIDMLARSTGGTLYFAADDAGDVAGATAIGEYNVTIPEPGSMALLGLGGLALLRRRR